ncbi:hypothetical protein BYT27DRAFT_6747755 [Phlegmacium glaucopus]|nr:hypothetical protein BYT27DRAFT_6747755 [Phlegmacium glaucopus]
MMLYLSSKTVVKKKFLLANKHITKLNSTLSVRIEELNAQISTLYVENLRLRASEIALTAQLKREREKSRKVMADAEAASQNLTKHLTYLRASYNITHVVDTPPTPPSPRARRPILNINTGPTSPPFNRIARPPNIPGIYEDEEPSPSSSEENPKQPTPPRKKSKSKPRLSASKLPLPTRDSSPIPFTSQPPVPVPYNVEPSVISDSSKRKPSRRQSGLLTVNTEALSVPRSGSPAFGSPSRLEAGLAAEEEEFAAAIGMREVEILEPAVEEETVVKKEKRKGKAKEQRESESEKDGTAETAVRSIEKKRPREDGSESAKFKQKDVSVPRSALQPIDNNVHEQTELDTQLGAASNRQFLRPPSPSSSLPRSNGSSSPAPANASETDGATNGRERRTRKSVNYAEPKLNTKMRKPDATTGSSDPPRPKKRSSAAAVMSNTTYKPSGGMDMGNEADADTEARSSLEVAPAPPPSLSGLVPPSDTSLLLRGVNGDYINPEHFALPPSRPGSAAAMYSPGPPTRTSGSTTSASSTTTTSTTATAAASSSSSSLLSQVTKRKKSRPQLLSDSESEGADADAEYVGGKGSSGSSSGSSNWINVEGRRKALPKRNAAVVAVTAIEDIRRHSLAY